ncbi:hypothetical protein J6590_088875 [Homalodisca vitripennis]|nr:hypothetical protein J6590_088875 [Homalodisca vitripennis]
MTSAVNVLELIICVRSWIGKPRSYKEKWQAHYTSHVTLKEGDGSSVPKSPLKVDRGQHIHSCRLSIQFDTKIAPATPTLIFPNRL